MKNDCQRCGVTTESVTIIPRVVNKSSPLQSINTQVVVCGDCYDEMEADEDISW